MHNTKWVLIISLILFLGGCAGADRRPESLHVTISPEKIYPGCVVVATVKAPQGSRLLTGRLDVMGSPVIPLKTRDNGLTWTFMTQIPLDAFWQPGRYRVLIEGQDSEGNQLWGETWVVAP